MHVVISCKDIMKVFGSGEAAVQALRGISFEIKAAENVAIMGPSGSGKSTLLQVIGCLDLPTSGQYCLDGVDVQTLDDDRLSELRGQYIGFVFQSFHLLPRLTLLENVALPLYYQDIEKSERLEKAQEALELVRLGGRSSHKPHQLSGGEKQRGAIARAMIHKPRLLLADEPTGNLDSGVKGEILDYLTLMNETQNVTLVMVTHDDETAARAKRIINLKDGKVV